jgi:hypothetical protein
MAGARVTVVMTARERHSLTERAVDSVVRGTRGPYRFLYLDVDSPAPLRDVFARRAAGWNLEVVRFDEPLWPNEARARIAPRLDTDYVVFMDNDVEVQPGWLDALVACADETGAGVVGPLYLWGDGQGAPTIHMADGRLREIVEDGGRVLEERHGLFDSDPAAVARELVRKPSDYAEFHCMLVRGELVRERTVLDPHIRCVHEHIDLCLAAKRAGRPVYLEPAARVTYLAFAPYGLDDLPLFRGRWSPAEADASIAAFCAKWGVIDDARSFGGVRNFVREHIDEIDPLHPVAAVRADRHAPMPASELRQSRSGLLDLAHARGYRDDEIAVLAEAWRLAQNMVDGGYRPCGRPFIDHLCGTAGVLLHFGFRTELVAAALLHASYSHCPPHPAGSRAAAEAMHALLGGDLSPVNQRVRAYTMRRPGAVATVFDAEILALVAANEVDMLLSGEVRYAARADLQSEETVAAMVRAFGILGVDGLAQTLSLAREQAPVAPALRTGVPESYRISADRKSLIGMTTHVLGNL